MKIWQKLALALLAAAGFTAGAGVLSGPIRSLSQQCWLRLCAYGVVRGNRN